MVLTDTFSLLLFFFATEATDESTITNLYFEQYFVMTIYARYKNNRFMCMYVTHKCTTSTW